MGTLAQPPLMRGRYFSRWTVLASCSIITCYCGIGYAYGLFSDTLKTNLDYSQANVDYIASFGELGLWSTFIIGLLMERVSFMSIFFLGAVTSSAGCVYIALSAEKTIPSEVWTMCLAFYIANFGTAAFASTAQCLGVRNFPLTDRGKVCGLLKSLMGVSSAILAVLFEGLFGGDEVVAFLLFLGVLLPVMGALTAVPLNVVPSEHLSYAVEYTQGVQPTLNHFFKWYAVLVVYLLTAIILTAFDVALPHPYLGVILIVYITSSFGLPMLYGKYTVKRKILDEAEPLLGGTSGVELEGARADDLPPSPIHSVVATEDMEWQDCLLDLRFWTLLLAFMCGAGNGLLVINNITSIADSLNVTAGSTLVSILGLSNALGRIFTGWASDRIVKNGYPRAVTLVINLIVSSSISLGFSIGQPALLYVLSVAAGIAYGGNFSVALALTGDLFGARHIGTNYGLLDLGPAAGSFLFATLLANVAYGGIEDCKGPTCFGSAFIASSIAAGGAAVATYVVLVQPQLKENRAELRRVGVARR